ncbi:hypothetical protein GQR58_029151 [Nymphon striatum]|nr:hypothetical protein GQR58_029151 [Nymphon striatum]
MSPIADRSVIDIKATSLQHKDIANQLPAAHALTSCDTVTLPNINLECYGRKVKGDMSTIRHSVWTSKMVNPKITSLPKLKSLPPTHEAFGEHVYLAHYQTSIWKAAISPDPTGSKNVIGPLVAPMTSLPDARDFICGNAVDLLVSIDLSDANHLDYSWIIKHESIRVKLVSCGLEQKCPRESGRATLRLQETTKKKTFSGKYPFNKISAFGSRIIGTEFLLDPIANWANFHLEFVRRGIDEPGKSKFSKFSRQLLWCLQCDQTLPVNDTMTLDNNFMKRKYPTFLIMDEGLSLRVISYLYFLRNGKFINYSPFDLSECFPRFLQVKLKWQQIRLVPMMIA